MLLHDGKAVREISLDEARQIANEFEIDPPY